MAASAGRSILVRVVQRRVRSCRIALGYDAFCEAVASYGARDAIPSGPGRGATDSLDHACTARDSPSHGVLSAAMGDAGNGEYVGW